LDELQPEPSLHTDKKEVIDRTQKALAGVWIALRPVVIPRVPVMLLPERSAEYFTRTRTEDFGMPLADVAKSEKAVHAFENVVPAIETLKGVLQEKEGKFILGDEVSFADFVVAGAWAFLEVTDRDGDLFERVVLREPVFKAHWEACQPWFARKD